MPVHDMAEKAFIARLKAGDEAAFRELIRIHQEKVFLHCLNMTGHRHYAEDIAQEVFLEVFRAIKNFRGEASLSTWIYRIANNKALEHIRKEQRKKRGGKDKTMIPLADLELPLAAPYDHPAIVLEKQEDAQWLYHCLECINERQRTALLMHQMDGLRQEEIAILMETTPSAVESLIHRAKQELRKLLVRQRPGPFQSKSQEYE